jgi:histidinol dehydrogenase
MNDTLDQILFSSSDPDFREKWEALRFKLQEDVMFHGVGPERDALCDILNDVAHRKDLAVAEYTEKFDGVRLAPEQFRITEEELKAAHAACDSDLLASVRQAINNVRRYQAEVFIGNRKHPGLRYTPIWRIGVCVPGASAPLPSSVIMTVVPAQVAGVKEIVVISPPRYNGSIHPVILAVCHELGVHEVYRIGGAQAVAALAFGTKACGKRVDKIVGPGNRWVQAAKKEVLGLVGIDSLAGPSEVLIIANDEANPAWVAADMLSQAEHNPGSAIAMTDSRECAYKILDELKKQVGQLSRSNETVECLTNYSGIVVFESLDEVIQGANDFASEHLEIQCGSRSRQIAERITNAGAIFIGPYTPVAVGDYWAGPSHTLPTGMTARFFSPLSSNDFIKSTSVIEYNQKKLAKSAPDIIRLARVEGLDAHAKSIEIRSRDKSQESRIKNQES